MSDCNTNYILFWKIDATTNDDPKYRTYYNAEDASSAEECAVLSLCDYPNAKVWVSRYDCRKDDKSDK